MRRLSAVTVALLLCQGQLCAQAPDASSQSQDPFGPDLIGATRSSAAHRKPADVAPTDGSAARPAKREESGRAMAFSSVRVGPNSAAQERIERALSQDATFDYLDQPLKHIVEDIAFNHSIPIVIDGKALDECGIDTRTSITRQLKGVSLQSALRLTLRPLGLTFIVRDEVLHITTPEIAASVYSIRYYPVAGLLPPDGDGEVLVELIKTFVAAETWCDSGGAVAYVDHLESLVVRQTADAFHEIDELLAAAGRLIRQHPSAD